MRTFMIAVLLGSLAPAIALADTPKRASKTPASLEVTSPAFENNDAIPSEFTCDGAEVAPPLTWSRVPAGTKSIAILVDDPDAPTGKFTHLLVTGLPPTTTALERGATLPEGAVASKNDKGRTGYAGPCPPSGRHRYEFHVYALDVALPKAMTRTELTSAVEGHILATGRLVGTYDRQPAR